MSDLNCGNDELTALARLETARRVRREARVILRAAEKAIAATEAELDKHPHPPGDVRATMKHIVRNSAGIAVAFGLVVVILGFAAMRAGDVTLLMVLAGVAASALCGLMAFGLQGLWWGLRTLKSRKAPYHEKRVKP